MVIVASVVVQLFALSEIIHLGKSKFNKAIKKCYNLNLILVFELYIKSIRVKLFIHGSQKKVS